VIDMVAPVIKVFSRVLTPAEGRAAMQNADTALLGQTVREKSPVPVGERVTTVFGKAGAAVKQVVHGVVDRIVPQPVRQAIAGGFKKVAGVVAAKFAEKAKESIKNIGGFIKQAIFG